jgi:hypothetical protein
MDSGHRSRSSNTKGARFAAATAQPAQAVKMCGEVATTTSTPRMTGVARIAATMKLP